MGILKKRNALLGWAVWKIGKRVIKRKAKSAVPGTGEGGGGAKAGLVAGLAALGAALFFWRRKSGGDETETPEP